MRKTHISMDVRSTFPVNFPFNALVEPMQYRGETVDAKPGVVSALATRIKRAWLVHRTVTELSSLNDAALKDIGLSRSGIHAAAVAAVDQDDDPIATLRA